MEFRTCPSCKASVLEDDVDDCPFCGASMSGKPSAKPAPKPAAPAKPSAPAAKPGAPVSRTQAAPGGAGKPAGPPARQRPAEPEPEKPAESDDPFDVDSLAMKNAVPVSPKPVKGRTVEVKCPMCETIGYVAPSHGGKDVKCCNPACRLPIFKAPRTQMETVAEPEKPKGLTTSMLAMIGLLLTVIAGVAVYWFVLREPPKPMAGPNELVPVDPNPQPDEPKGPTDVVVQQEKVLTIEEIRKSILDEMPKITIQNSIRSRPLGRQIAAEALLITGDTAGARSQLEQLTKLGQSSEHYVIEPVGIMLQQMISAGDQAGAGPLLTNTIPITKSLPEVGRSSFDAATILAAAAARLDRTQDLLPLIERQTEKDSGGRGRLSLAWNSGMSRQSYHLSNEAQQSHLEFSVDPVWVTTCVQLCRFEQWDAALKWARSAPHVAVQDAAQAAWAGLLSAHVKRKPDAALEAKLNSTIQSAGLAAKVRMLAAMAEFRLNSREANVSTAELEQLLSSVSLPEAMLPPDLVTTYESKGKLFGGLPDPRPNISLALAFADVANLKLRQGDTAGGWGLQEKAMVLLRAVAPSPTAMQATLDETKGNSANIEAQLNQALKLGNSNPKIKTALSQYRLQVEAILKVSNERFQLQQGLLRRAARYGLIAEAWKTVVERNSGDLTQQEPYMLKTSLPFHLHSRATQIGNNALMVQIVAELPQDEETQKQLIKDATENGIVAAETDIKAGNATKAAASLKPIYNSTANRYAIDLHVLDTASRLSDKSVAAAQAYIRSLPDPTIKEDAYRMLAARSVVKGEAPELWKILQKDRELTTTEKAMSYLGFLEAIQATGAK